MRYGHVLLATLCLFAGIGITAGSDGQAKPEKSSAAETPEGRTPESPDSPLAGASKAWTPEIPRTWDEEAMTTLEIQLVVPEASAEHVSAEYYYKIPVRPILKSYPVYHPDWEPPGYMEELKKKAPAYALDFSEFKTKEDWIAAGEVVFDSPIVYNGLNQVSDLRNREWYKKTGVPITRDGIMPFNRYVILEKGKVSVGEFGCVTCHTRVMPDGSVVKGAQGNYPLGRLDALQTQRNSDRSEDPKKFLEKFRSGLNKHYGAPWLGEDDPQKRHETMTLEELVAAQDAIPAGVQHRVGVSYEHPVQVPDLIGVKDRRYLDRTGLVKHRSPGDIMRYAALNQFLSYMDSYGGFLPFGGRPNPERLSRYSDQELYALALYVYSLEPPENPNKYDELAQRGEQVFQREECWRCHKPPLYTNNKLTPVDGYEVPGDHPQHRDILPFSVGTDPGLALKTRRGTGFYKVPSLKGLWYRGPLEHSGSVATLEDWSDPARLRDDYRPTGFRGAGIETRPVKGHRYILRISEEDRRALIAFLKTL